MPKGDRSNCKSGALYTTQSIGGFLKGLIDQHDIDMTALERRLDGLLQDRKGKGRFRQLREYDENELIDFVGHFVKHPILRGMVLFRHVLTWVI